MTDLGTIQAANTVDARGSACPGPLLEAKKGIGKVKVGEMLEVSPVTRAPETTSRLGQEGGTRVPGCTSEADGYDKLFVRKEISRNDGGHGTRRQRKGKS